MVHAASIALNLIPNDSIWLTVYSWVCVSAATHLFTDQVTNSTTNWVNFQFFFQMLRINGMEQRVEFTPFLLVFCWCYASLYAWNVYEAPHGHDEIVIVNFSSLRRIYQVTMTLNVIKKCENHLQTTLCTYNMHRHTRTYTETDLNACSRTHDIRLIKWFSFFFRFVCIWSSPLSVSLCAECVCVVTNLLT